MGRYDDFFDEDGNIITTQRDIELKKKQDAERKRQEEEQRRKELHDFNKDIAIDKRSQQLEEEYERERKKQQEQEEWMKLPEWIKNMKVVPLDAPPTEGRKEKLLYSVTKKVELTDHERQYREKLLRRRNTAMEQHTILSQDLPDNAPLSPVTIISTGKQSGGTTMTRCLSDALQMSRENTSMTVSIDLSSAGSDMYTVFNKTAPSLNMRIFLKRYKNNSTTLPPVSILPTCRINQQEFFLDNRDNSRNRIEPSMDDVVSIYKTLRQYKGFVLFDCDTMNMDATKTAMLFSNNVIFVVEPRSESIAAVAETLQHYRQFARGSAQALRVINNIDIVLLAQDPRLMTRDNLMVIQQLLHKTCDDNGLDHSRSHIIPYDKGLSVHPMSIRTCSYATTSRIRDIAGTIVSTSVETYSP